MIGRTISHYRIEEKIGEGGMGVVYRAEDLRLGRRVAIKFLKDSVFNEPESRRRFRREAKAAAALNHPNICPIHEIDEVDGRLFIVMAHAPGESLSERLERGLLPVDEALEIAAQCAEGLREAHAAGVVHRDVKPANIFIRRGDDAHPRVTIMDFGLARLARQSSLTREGFRLGTVAYMSPEQTLGTEVDERTDLWSLGIVLYEMLIGRPPFEGDYDQAVSYSIVNEDPQPVTSLRAGLPIEVEWIFSKSLAKRLDERYQSAKEMLVDLRALARKVREQGGVRRSTGPLSGGAVRPQPASRTLRAARLAPAAAAIATAGLLLGGYVGTRSARVVDEMSNLQLSQVTRDAGLTTTPALSPDGALVAYASDRAEAGNLDIWVRQLSGGGAVRVDAHPAADHSPAFSPDGARLAFRSERDGGGIYIAPTLGGEEPRLAVAGGRRPRYSPDGARLAGYTGPPNSLEGSRVFVSSADGSRRVLVTPDFDVAAMPIWVFDDGRLAFWGRRRLEPEDMWILRLGEDQARPAGLGPKLSQRGLRLVSLDAWDARSSAVIVSAVRQDSVNLWRIPLDPVREIVSGDPVRLTLGADEREATPPVAGRVVFACSRREINVWALPLDRAGRGADSLRRLTNSAAADFSSSASSDGRRVVFRSTRSGSVDIWTKDLTTGVVKPLTADSAFETGPRASPDGLRVAYSVGGSRERPIFVARTAGDEPTVAVCADCGPPIAWTSDSRRLLFQRRNEGVFSVWRLDLDSGETKLLIDRPPLSIYAGSLSRDDRWFTFKVDLDSTRTKIFVTPLADRISNRMEDWTAVSEGRHWDDLPRFAADARTLYFTSDRDGFRCVWARRFDPEKGAPFGEPFAVEHLHRMDLSMGALSLNEFELSATENELVFPLLTQSGNIWMIEPVEGRPR